MLTLFNSLVPLLLTLYTETLTPLVQTNGLHYVRNKQPVYNESWSILSKDFG